MRSRSMYDMFAVSFVLIGFLSTGCATTKTDQTTSECGSDYSCVRDMAFKYRQQADRLSMLAERYEVEAAAMTGQDAKQQRDRAQAFRLEAQQANEQAQEYRRQLPHNMVQ
jgi:hypothetical protein